GRQLLAIAEFDFDALERCSVGNGTVGLLNADAPRNGFAAGVAIVQHAERPLLAHQRVADDVALEEQLARRRGADLRIGSGNTQNSKRQSDSGKRQGFHRPSPVSDYWT